MFVNSSNLRSSGGLESGHFQTRFSVVMLDHGIIRKQMMPCHVWRPSGHIKERTASMNFLKLRRVYDNLKPFIHWNACKPAPLPEEAEGL